MRRLYLWNCRYDRMTVLLLASWLPAWQGGLSVHHWPNVYWSDILVRCLFCWKLLVNLVFWCFILINYLSKGYPWVSWKCTNGRPSFLRLSWGLSSPQSRDGDFWGRQSNYRAPWRDHQRTDSCNHSSSAIFELFQASAKICCCPHFEQGFPLLLLLYYKLYLKFMIIWYNVILVSFLLVNEIRLTFCHEFCSCSFEVDVKSYMKWIWLYDQCIIHLSILCRSWLSGFFVWKKACWSLLLWF